MSLLSVFKLGLFFLLKHGKGVSFYQTGFSFGRKCVFILITTLVCDWKAADVLYIRSIQGQIMSVFLLQPHTALYSSSGWWCDSVSSISLRCTLVHLPIQFLKVT